MPIVTSSTTSASSTAPVTLPYERLGQVIYYRSEDGDVGATAFPINYEQLYNLKGRLLTLIDATFIDPEQRKAHKDIVWQTLQAWMTDIEHAGGYNSLHPPERG